jgi:hypothetical protein
VGLLRLAPRLSIVPGGRRREPNWPGIAGGIAAAMHDEFDPDDSPVAA